MKVSVLFYEQTDFLEHTPLLPPLPLSCFCNHSVTLRNLMAWKIFCLLQGMVYPCQDAQNLTRIAVRGQIEAETGVAHLLKRRTESFLFTVNSEKAAIHQ